jgi:PilZ domain-containing protein
MFSEKRSHPRVRINRVARIHADQGITCECTITDISEGGARLFVADVELPQQFFLHISGDKMQREECKVVWKLGGEMGVQFVTRVMTQERSDKVDQLRALAQFRFNRQPGDKRA